MAPDHVLTAGVVRLVADTYRESIARRTALIEAGHAEATLPAVGDRPIIIMVDETEALCHSNRIDTAHLALAEELIAKLSVAPRRRARWWHR